MGSWDHIFILGVCPSTEGEYALSAAGLVSPGEDHRDCHGCRSPKPLPACQ